MRWVWVVAGVALWLAARPCRAQDTDSWREHLVFSLSERVRGEFVDWFQPRGGAPTGAERYAFFASQLRAGVRVLLAPVELTLEAQDTRLAGLPDDATLAPPQGALGPGAVYFLHSHDTEQGETFLKQGHLTLRLAGVTATAGRFEYRDGLETLPADATLLAVKRTRIAERLVGSFDFTHVTRSLDGVRLAYDRPDWNVTAFAARPTMGGFEVSANRELDRIGLTGLALGLKRLPSDLPMTWPFDARLFYLFYGDQRRETVKADNRAPTIAAADHDHLSIHTIGAHVLTAIDAGPGVIDLLAWAAAQTGDWGRDRHSAWAYALEAGYQLPRVPWAPWLRFGFDRSSGDDDPGDGRHATFFQVLPTARTYALLPFHNLMNNQDVLAELILRPHAKVTIRADWHHLTLTEGRDRWYSGGGASNDTVFGFAGAPADGRRGLGDVVNLSVSAAVLPQLTLAGYYGHAFGGAVVRRSFADTSADYGFIEATVRY